MNIKYKFEDLILVLFILIFIILGIVGVNQYFVIIVILTSVFLKLPRGFKDIRVVFLYFLIIFLPFYPSVRAYLMINKCYLLQGIINYLRDFIILILVVLTFIKNRSLFKFRSEVNNSNYKLMYISMLLIAINYSYGFVISIFRGYFSLGIMGIHLNLIPLLMVFIIYNIDFRESDLKKMMKYITYIGIIVSIIGIYFYFFRPIIFGQLFSVFRQFDETPQQVLNYSRMVSVLLSPNIFGTFMSINLIVSFSAYYRNNKHLDSGIYLISILLSLIGLSLSMSRGAWMFGFVGVMTIIHFNNSKRILDSKLLKIILLAIMVLIILATINPTLIYIIEGRFESLLSFDNDSSYGRLDNWFNAFRTLGNNFAGYGLGVGGINLIRFPEISESTGIDVIDGFYMKTIIETGIVGLVLFSAHILLMIIALYRLIIHSDNNKYYVLTLAIFLGVLTQSIGSNVFDFVSIAPFIWIFVGIAAKGANEKIFEDDVI